MELFLSIIIPVFNRAHLIGATLESVIPQCASDCEVIVIDDGSTDGIADRLAGYIGKIIFIRTENQGAGAARNIGIQKARGEYAAFLDSDDVWFPWVVDNLRRVIAETGKPSVLQTAFVWLNDGQALPKSLPKKLEYRTYDDVLSYAMCNSVSGAGATVVKTEILRRCGGFSDRRIVGEDIDLIFKLSTEKGCVLIDSPPSFGYCRHDGMTTLSGEAWYRGALFLIEQEKRHAYPGGEMRQQERRDCLARDAAYRSLVCLKGGDILNCFRIYLLSWTWQVQCGQLGYVIKTPIRMLMAMAGLWPNRIIRSKKLNER